MKIRIFETLIKPKFSSQEATDSILNRADRAILTEAGWKLTEGRTFTAGQFFRENWPGIRAALIIFADMSKNRIFRAMVSAVIAYFNAMHREHEEKARKNEGTRTA